MRYLSLLLVFLLSISTNAQEYFPKNDGVKQSFKNFTAIKNATIYYTKDGTTPNESSEQYQHPIEIKETTTLKFVIYKLKS